MPRAPKKTTTAKKKSPAKAKSAKETVSRKSTKKSAKSTAGASSREAAKAKSTPGRKSSARGFSKRQLTAIEKRLLERRQELREQMNTVTMEPLGGETAEPGDVGDWASASFQMDVTAGILESETRELQALDEALRRVQEGSYGICRECGCEIPTARLKAVPQATSCLECKMALERGRPGGVRPQRWRMGANVVQTLDTDDGDADDQDRQQE